MRASDSTRPIHRDPPDEFNRQFNRQYNSKIDIKFYNKDMLKNNMGPMGPRGLGPWALWAPGTLGPNSEDFQNLTKVAPNDIF